MEKENIPKTLCYIGFIFMIIISVQSRNLSTTVFSMFILMWFHKQNMEEEREKHNYELFMSLNKNRTSKVRKDKDGK